MTGLRDQLKAGLSATAQSQGDEAKPTVFELAERIKTLKAAHSIAATPQRVRQKQSSAEEPVTARIRRQATTDAPSHLPVEPAGEPTAIASLPAALDRPPSTDRPLTFQESRRASSNAKIVTDLDSIHGGYLPR